MRTSGRALDRLIAGGLALYGLAVALALVLNGGAVSGAAEPSAGWAHLRWALTGGAESLTYDDGFYYLKIAQQIAHGSGSTFDGVHETNGYHPLWLLCLVPIFRLTSSAEVALLLAVALQGLLLSISAGLVYGIARLDFVRCSSILAAVLWIHAELPYRTAMSGLECGLYGVGVLSVMYLYGRSYRRDRPTVRSHFGLGILLSLTFLARLDSIVLFGCVALAVGVRERTRGVRAGRIARLAALALPVASVFALYVGINARWFGHPFPVSGAIKRDWSARLLQEDPVYRLHGWALSKMACLLWPFAEMKHAYVLFLFAGSGAIGAAWLIAILLRRRARLRAASLSSSPEPQPLSFWWGPFVLFSLLQIAIFATVYHDGYSFQRWYYVIQPCLGALLIARVADRGLGWTRQVPRSLAWPRHLPFLLPAALIAGVVFASVRTVGKWHHEARLGTSREPLYAAAQWVRANVPDGAVVGSWNAGTVGYLSGKRVVNLDGLVNSWDFYQRGEHDLCKYWRDAGITYLVDTFEVDHELSFIEKYYAPSVDFSPCAARLDRVWIGPAYLNTTQHAAAFRIR